jgi:predicted enzyme related to lactoylglutathione lyase
MGNPLVFFEVTGHDGGRLRQFYGELFGWEFRDSGDPTYGLVTAAGTGIGGGVGNSRDGGVGGTTFYVDDVSAVLGKAARLGSSTVMPPANISGGLTIAALADPEGHVVGLSMSAVRR